MKKIFLSITAAMLMMIMPAQASDYDDISEYALFLTDKMAYELNLTEEQYEAAYEINFDYLYDVMRNGNFNFDRDDFYDDLYGRAWESRNRDLRIILLNTQYDTFRRLKYFYRPFYRSHGRITIRIYNYYPRRDYLYFGCPKFVVTYRGGHGWRHYRHHSYYSGRAWHSSRACGMRDGYRRGNRYYHNATHNHGGSYNSFRGNRHRYEHNRECHDSFRDTGSRRRVSSTRTTVNDRNRGFGGSRSNVDRGQRLPDNRFSPRKNRSNENRSSRSVSRSDRKERRSNNSGSNSRSRRGGFGGGR